jgi:hypothetical protein
MRRDADRPGVCFFIPPSGRQPTILPDHHTHTTHTLINNTYTERLTLSFTISEKRFFKWEVWRVEEM